MGTAFAANVSPRCACTSAVASCGNLRSSSASAAVGVGEEALASTALRTALGTGRVKCGEHDCCAGCVTNAEVSANVKKKDAILPRSVNWQRMGC